MFMPIIDVIQYHLFKLLNSHCVVGRVTYVSPIFAREFDYAVT
jgi:hypothetical protein